MSVSRNRIIIVAVAVLAAAIVAPQVASAQGVQIVRVIAPTKALTNPGFGDLVKVVPTTTPYGHDQMQLRVLASVPGEVDPATGSQRTYYKVHLPYRRSSRDTSNGYEGWVASDTVQVITSPWTVTVNRSRRTLTIRKNGHRWASWRVVVGRASMPTPKGQFAIYGKTTRASVDGPGIMPFAYSHVLAQFDGGPGMLALHGVSAALSDPMGSAASHGCVRNPNGRTRWMLSHLPIGTPVDVV